MVERQRLFELIDCVSVARQAEGLSPDSKALLGICYRVVSDAASLPKMASVVREPLVQQAIDRAISMIDLAMYLSPSCSNDARQKLHALSEVFFGCLSMAAESERVRNGND